MLNDRRMVPVETNANSPRMRVGESVIVERTETPNAGDDVMVVLEDGRVGLGELRHVGEQLVVLSFYNPEVPSISIKRGDVRSFHAVVARGIRPVQH